MCHFYVKVKKDNGFSGGLRPKRDRNFLVKDYEKVKTHPKTTYQSHLSRKLHISPTSVRNV